MARHPSRRHPLKIAAIGNSLPRQCGIATFTTDLVSAIGTENAGQTPATVVMNDTPEGYRYPPHVRFEVSQNRLPDYHQAAEFLNMSHFDIVCLQHEYGIFGGNCGSHILHLLSNLRMPVVTTLHTVLKEPTALQREVMVEIARLSDRLVVMSQRSVEFLKGIYNVPEDKIAFVHHGIPDTPFVDPAYFKDMFGVEGKKVILTFGLLSPGKGIEYMIRAMPGIAEEHPDVVYIVLGATHPHVRKQSGESYRHELQRLARQLGVGENVIFQNRFVELDELCEYLGSADVYVTPYLNETQIVSGTLIYAMGAGKAIVSTPYWYAEEMLAEERGHVVPFRDSEALAESVVELLSHDTERHAMRKRAYQFCRDAVWPQVARQYLEVFDQVREARAHDPVHPYRPRTVQQDTVDMTDLPDLKLDHLIRMTDDTGIFQHAKYTVPDRAHGYCIDDNARALMAAVFATHLLPDDRLPLELAARYLSFIRYAFNRELGLFRNFMGYDRRWLEEEGSSDSNGRTLWGLGVAVGYLQDLDLISLASNLFHRVLPAAQNFHAPRTQAFALVGLHAYLRRYSGDRDVRQMREMLAMRLFKAFQDNACDEWPWLEDRLTYANAKLPQALLLSGQWMQNSEMVEMGLKSLEWLLEQDFLDGHFAPVGNRGWHERGGERARFDQQPIEAHAVIEACLEAHAMTRDDKWLEAAVNTFSWFLGQNDFQTPIYDDRNGGGRDGLQPDGVNENQGAESTLAWLLSLCLMRMYQADRVLDANIRGPGTSALPAQEYGRRGIEHEHRVEQAKAEDDEAETSGTKSRD